MSQLKAALLGHLVGDALVVPYEFRSREEMAAQPPSTKMEGYGTHQQPPGTWSDDGSLMLCLAESLLNGYDLRDQALRMIAWRNEAHWAARGEVFDIGMTTDRAITRLETLLLNGDYKQLKLLRYLGTEQENGNGSLMRILPLLFYLKGKPIAEQWELIHDASALSHRHIRAAMCCLVYLKMGEYLLEGTEKHAAYDRVRSTITEFWDTLQLADWERQAFKRFIQNDIREVSIGEIKTGGYVIESMESCLFFLLREANFSDTVLNIIKLGHDTDTSAAIVGGLAGLLYGTAGIPEDWTFSLARLEEVEDLISRLEGVLGAA